MRETIWAILRLLHVIARRAMFTVYVSIVADNNLQQKIQRNKTGYFSLFDKYVMI